MKRVHLFVLALVAAVTCWATEPDFAFPQTVDKNARTDLKAAVKAGDAQSALNALMRVYVANYLIGEEGAGQQSIELAEQTVAKFANSPMEGVFYALMAKMYLNEFHRNYWSYTLNKLPLKPRPADITEWSGEQYMYVIDSLLQRSVANSAALSALKIGDYADIVEADKLTQIFYPTLYDFVCSNAAYISYSCTNYVPTTVVYPDTVTIYADAVKYCDAALASALKRGSKPAETLWRCQRIYFSSEDYEIGCQEYKALYLSMKDSEYASLPLDKYLTLASLDTDDELDELKWAIEQIDYVLGRWPSTPFAQALKSSRQELLEKNVCVSYNSACLPGQPLQVTIENFNTESYTIDVYRLNDRKGLTTKELKKMWPVQSIKMSCSKDIPFYSFDTLNITFDKQGYYAIISNSSIFSERGVWPVRCFDAMPFALNSDSAAWMAVVNPQTGAPLAGADIVYKYKNQAKKAITFKPTDAMGLTDVSSLRYVPSGSPFSSMDVTYGGYTNTFDPIGLYFPGVAEEEAVRYERLLTDRAIYHPGDSVHYLLIAKEGEALLKDTKISIKLQDATYQHIGDAEVTTDEWGRAYGAFALPTTGLTGNYSIRTDYASVYFMVSDYRMPEFELVDVKVARDVPSKGEVTITGRAVYYSGMPMAGATVTADLNECIWRWRPMNAGTVASLKATTSDNGEFSIVFTSSDLSSPRAYGVTLSAVSPSGSTTQALSVTFSLGKQYVISLDVPGVVNGEKPFTPTCQLASYSGEEVKFPIKWTISTLDSVTVLSGNSLKDIDLSSVKPDYYRLTVEPVDTTLADAESRTFVLYNVASGIVPETNRLIWMPEESITLAAGKKGEFLFGVTDSTYVYCGTATAAGVALTGKWYGKGYHTIKVNAAEGKLLLATAKDFNTYSKIIPISIEPEKPLQIVCETFRDKLLPGATETWRLRVVDGEGRGVSAALALDMYNRSLDALDEQNFSVKFPSYKPQVNFYVRTSFIDTHLNLSSYERLNPIDYDDLTEPEFSLWKYLSYSDGLGRIRIYGYGTGNLAQMDKCEDEVVVCEEAAPIVRSPKMYSASSSAQTADDGFMQYELAVEEEADGGSAATNPDDIQFRDSEVPLAIWAPQLTTDAEGNVCYTFTVPNANASWRLYAAAWTQGLRSANLSRDFFANKPLMVQPNAPRFLRAGDKADVAIALLNNADSLASVQAVLELFDPATGAVYDTQTFACDIDSMAQATFNAHVEASSSQTAIGLRVKAFTSRFGDGEQLVIPVLPADASLIETTPFYLNPGDSTFSMTLPAQPGARISLTYCENPAWTIVSALPGLREDKGKYANSAAAAIFSAAISQGIIHDNPEIAAAIAAWQANPADSTLVSMLEKNEDLKIALLNATPWVQAAQSDSERMARLSLLFDKKLTSKSITDAIDVLQQLQRPDGGWAWGDWCEESSPWVTGNVLGMMAELKSYGWLPNDKGLNGMIANALKYWDGEVEGPDLNYSIVRKQFTDVPISTRGQQAITKTVNDVLKHWKSYSDPAYKALAAQALFLNGYPSKARQVMSSISEFGVWSESQGLRFPSVNGLPSYAALLTAYAMIEPGSRQVDGLRQQLIVRKQATDWGSSVVTSEVVAAILSSGTRWTVEAQGADITAGGESISPDGPIAKATGELRANLSEHAGQTLTITAPATGPSYGAVYSQFSQAMADVKASSCDDLSIEKTMMVRQGTEWAYVNGPLKVGDRVKVQLTIHSRRNMQYVAIIDERPAAFEPVDQLPGWVWSQSAGFYRENRDAYTAMHIVSLAPGTYQLTYEMNVTTAGTFSSGVATIQSQYAPELSAHSAGTALQVLPN